MGLSFKMERKLNQDTSNPIFGCKEGNPTNSNLVRCSRKLAIEIFFNRKYIEHSNKGIFPADRRILPIYYLPVPILAREGHFSKTSSILSHVASSLEVQSQESIWVVKQFIVQTEPKSVETIVPSRNELLIIEQKHMDKLTNRVLPVRGIYGARKNVPFRVLVMNFSKRTLMLHNDRQNSVGTEPAKTIIV